jgi:hypothetical protein
VLTKRQEMKLSKGLEKKELYAQLFDAIDKKVSGRE